MASLALCRQLLAVAEVPVPEAETTETAWRSPHCGGPMVVVERLTAAQLEVALDSA
jgi:hypothetical protein